MTARYDLSWKPLFTDLFHQPFMKQLSAFIVQERQQQQVFPAAEDVFRAFQLTPLSDVKVVILGQDPYHNIGQAQGLSFSVPAGMAIPPSLKNIFKELVDDIPGFQAPSSGDLTAWATQGVLLLNATLTVRAHEAGSHQKKGWEQFTDAIIKHISDSCPAVVFLLWGSYAQQKVKLIDTSKHAVLSTVHPSPLSSYRGFFGCRHFSQANTFLASKGLSSIDWRLGV